jgi:hypothetical protein
MRDETENHPLQAPGGPTVAVVIMGRPGELTIAFVAEHSLPPAAAGGSSVG